MRQFIRAMVVPFFVALFPAVWYINRNVATRGLSPDSDSTTGLVAIALGVAILGSIVFAAVVAFFRDDRRETGQYTVPYRQRVLQPDTTALVVFFIFISVSSVWAVIEMGGVGPAVIGEILQILLLPAAIPLLVLAPLAIQFHWAVIVGLMLCVLWMSLLGNLVSDVVRKLVY